MRRTFLHKNVLPPLVCRFFFFFPFLFYFHVVQQAEYSVAKKTQTYFCRIHLKSRRTLTYATRKGHIRVPKTVQQSLSLCQLSRANPTTENSKTPNETQATCLW